MKKLYRATRAGNRRATTILASFLTPSSSVAVSDVALAVTQQGVAAESRLSARGALLGDAHVTPLVRQPRRLTLVSRKGVGMSRLAPLTSEVVTAISDGARALNMVFLSDGVIDEHEMDVIRGFRHAQAIALRADWSRRARQSIENGGEINARLEREYREIEAEFATDAA